LAGASQRIFSGFRRHIGIAVMVPADPRSELDQMRHFTRLHFGAVNLADGLNDFRVKLRNGLEENTAVIETHLDLIEYSGRRTADLIGLPPRRDLSGHFLLDFFRA